MNYKAILGEAQKLFADAKVILENPQATDEEKAKIPQMIEDGKKLQLKAEQLKDIAANADKALAMLSSNPGADNTPSGEFETWNDFLVGVWKAQHANPLVRQENKKLRWFSDKEDDGPGQRKDMSEGVGAAGGFLLPEGQLNQLYAVMGEGAIVRPRATVIPMGSRTVSLPLVDQQGTTAGKDHWHGGLIIYHAEEASQKQESDVKWGRVTLNAHKTIGYTRSSDELVEDSPISLSAFLGGPMGFGGAFRWQEDYDFLRGSGAGEALGIVGAGATIQVAAQANPPAAGSIYTDLVNMMAHLLPSSLTKAVWVINQLHLPDLLAMNGPAANPSYIWGNAREGIPNTLLGLPVIFTEKLPAPGSVGSILLVDFSYYLIGDRRAFTVETTQYDRWAYDQTSWRAVSRYDGQPWLKGPITLADGVTTVSPFVKIGAKST